MTTTSPRPGPVRGAQRGGEMVAGRRGFAWLARAGLVARGVVYGIVGILALKLAVGSGGKATNQRGALMTLAQEPFGQALLIATAVGLAGYATWRLVRTGVGHGSEQNDTGLRRGELVSVRREGARAHIDALSQRYLGHPQRGPHGQRLILTLRPTRIRSPLGRLG